MASTESPDHFQNDASTELITKEEIFGGSEVEVGSFESMAMSIFSVLPAMIAFTPELAFAQNGAYGILEGKAAVS